LINYWNATKNILFNFSFGSVWPNTLHCTFLLLSIDVYILVEQVFLQYSEKIGRMHFSQSIHILVRKSYKYW
jgi:hypothetical protein